MNKTLSLSIAFCLWAPVGFSQTEELSGPPAVYALEKHDNLEDESIALPFLELDPSMTGTGKAVDEVVDVTKTVRELIEEDDFIANIRFVNRRSNRHHDMVFDSKNQLSNTSEVESLITSMAEVEQDSMDVSSTDALNFKGQLYKDMQVQVLQCLADYNGVYGNDAAFVQVADASSSLVMFEGWVYKKRPSVHVFQHPVYSMNLISCE